MIEQQKNEKENILEYYLRRARALRMLYYKTGKKKYASIAARIAKEGRKSNETLRH